MTQILGVRNKGKSDACYYSPRGACNYESSGDCVSCALYKR